VIKEFRQLAGSMWPDDECVIHVAKPAAYTSVGDRADQSCGDDKVVHVLKHHATKTYGGVEVKLHELLTLAIDGVSGQLRSLAILRPRQGSPENRSG
jgi:hypothetical protein